MSSLLGVSVDVPKFIELRKCQRLQTGLAKQNRWDEATVALQWLRASSADELKVELAEIHAQIEEEIRATSGRSIKELFQRQNLFRLLWACGIMVLAVGTGQTAILYYAPTVFKQIGFTGQNPGLLASGVFTVVKVIVTMVFLTLLVQNFKRKHLLLFGSALMSIMLFILGALLKTHPPSPKHSANDSSSGRTMVRCSLEIEKACLLEQFCRWQPSISTS